MYKRCYITTWCPRFLVSASHGGCRSLRHWCCHRVGALTRMGSFCRGKECSPTGCLFCCLWNKYNQQSLEIKYRGSVEDGCLKSCMTEPAWWMVCKTTQSPTLLTFRKLNVETRRDETIFRYAPKKGWTYSFWVMCHDIQLLMFGILDTGYFLPRKNIFAGALVAMMHWLSMTRTKPRFLVSYRTA